MPAQRSRTSGWRSCLQQLLDRHGSLQIALAPTGIAGGDFIWSVKLLALSDEEIHIEMPAAIGEPIPLEEGTNLLGIIAIGQNRWMFQTSCLGVHQSHSHQHRTASMRLQMPTNVERCQRRQAFRISTDLLSPPEVTVWPLLDPRSVVIPEQLCQLRIKQFQAGESNESMISESDALPDVGPPFSATMVNIGGGGLGLQVEPCNMSGITRHRMMWLRFPPLDTEGPQLCLTAKMMHSHLEAGGATYLGMRFDFTFNPAYRAFVIQHITRRMALQQRSQRHVVELGAA